MHRSARLGRFGERVVWWLWRLGGYRGLAHDLSMHATQIDLLIKKNETWVLIEVKTRWQRHSQDPAMWLSWQQRERLRRAALALEHDLLCEGGCRRWQGVSSGFRRFFRQDSSQDLSVRVDLVALTLLPPTCRVWRNVTDSDGEQAEGDF